MKVNVTSYAEASDSVIAWARQGQSRYVCISNVHSAMEAFDSAQVQNAINGADLVTPDGMPLVWVLRLLGFQHATRVYGPDLTPILLEKAAEAGLPIGLYGGSEAGLEALCSVLLKRFPTLKIAYWFSPPFRSMTPEEDARAVQEINASGVRIVLVGLGAPKQDLWMAEHRGRIHAVALGVGAAFDFLAGTKPQAPVWMRSSGLEWLFRLATEPRRLWKRYLKHNPRFVLLVARQLLSGGAQHPPLTRERS